MHVVKEDFATSNLGIAILQISPSKPQGLYLGTQQDHASLILIEDEIVVPGLTILAYDLDAVHFTQDRSAILYSNPDSAGKTQPSEMRVRRYPEQALSRLLPSAVLAPLPRTPLILSKIPSVPTSLLQESIWDSC